MNFDGTVYGAFLRGMREAGYVENRDFNVEWRFAEGRFELFPSLAEELVRAKVDVIVVALTAAIRAVMSATGTIPIVMAVGQRSSWKWVCYKLGASNRQCHRIGKL